MSLGSRWQALLFLLLRVYFHIAECQNFEKGGLNSLEYVIYWQHTFFLNHLFCSLCIIVFLLNAEVKPLFFKWQMDTNQYMWALLYSLMASVGRLLIHKLKTNELQSQSIPNYLGFSCSTSIVEHCTAGGKEAQHPLLTQDILKMRLTLLAL